MGIELVTERRTRGGMFYDVRCFGYAVRTKCTGRKTEERRTKINGSWKLMRPIIVMIMESTFVILRKQLHLMSSTKPFQAYPSLLTVS